MNVYHKKDNYLHRDTEINTFVITTLLYRDTELL